MSWETCSACNSIFVEDTQAAKVLTIFAWVRALDIVFLIAEGVLMESGAGVEDDVAIA
jgi:hypothetical protein